MPALLTQHDREVYQLQRQIEERELWIRDEAGNRRAVDFHKAKLAELRAELEKLQENGD
jgi:hypothetical protein